MENDNKTPEELAAEQEAQQLAKAKADAEAEALEVKAKLLEKSKEDIYEELQKTRSEAKERRLKEKELSEKLAEYEKAKADEIEKDKKAKGKFEELLAEYKQKLDKAEPLANKFIEYAENKRKTIKDSLMEKDLWIESFSNIELTELETLAAKLLQNSKTVPTDDSKNFTKNNGKDTRDPAEKLMSIYK